MRRRVDLIAPPFAGHLHPLLGIGQRLAVDYDVRVISSDRAQADIAASGLAGPVVLAGRDAEIRAIVEPPYPVGSDPRKLNAQLTGNLRLLAAFHQELAALWQREGRPDLALVDFTLPAAGVTALAHGVPWWTTHPSPCVIETPDGPPGYLGGWRPGRTWLGRTRDAAGRAVIRAAKRVAHALHRPTFAALGLPAVYREDGTEAAYSPDRIFALGIRELEFPRAWPASVDLVGPVLFTPPTAVAPPPFVAGKRHVLVTIGTHLPWHKDAVAAAVATAAAARPDLEFHFSDGRADAAGASAALAVNCRRLPYVSYEEYLPRYALVVHHGGAGVMYHTLAAGTPSLVHPLDYDQFDHAARLVSAGVARPLRRLDDLASAVDAALADDAMAAACRRMVTAIACYDAVDAIARAVQSRIG